MNSRFSAALRNRTFTAVILGLVGLLAVGLIAVAGVTLYNKMKSGPAPTPTTVQVATQTPVAAITSAPTARPTATLVVAAPPTAQAVATALPTKPAATAAPTGAPTTSAPTAAPTPVPGADGVPNTGASLLPALLAGGGFAALLVTARHGRRSPR